MPSPLVTFRNGTDLTIDWGHDFHQGGPIVGYEIEMAREALEEPHMIYVSGLSQHRTDLSLDELHDGQEWAPNCLTNTTVYKYNFTIRAVTEDPATNKRFFSDWSSIEVVPGYCKSKLIERHLKNCFVSSSIAE